MDILDSTYLIAYLVPSRHDSISESEGVRSVQMADGRRTRDKR